jgi:hypothetical protein
VQTRSGLDAWIETVRQHMPHLSKPQAVVLAMWSFGMVVTKSCGLTTVAALLAALLGKKENTLRQRLREWYWEEKQKRGDKRQELDVSTCFVPLIRWVLSRWPATEQRLALALDATTLSDRFVVLAVSIVYRGCAIPIAWVVLPAGQKGAWKPHWLKLLQIIKGSIPEGWFVIVMADRGLYARWLYTAIVDNGWHPFLRINAGGKYRRQGSSQFRLLSKVVTQVGQAWSGPVVCFKSHPLACTLLARWDEGYDEPWLIITDLSPEQADAFWYAMRPWIECGFKDTKRGGWQWQNTRITDAKRAERFWLAIAVATLWVVSVGSEAETTLPASSFDDLPVTHIARRRPTKRSRPRLLSCFRRGVVTILAALITGRPLPLGRFYPAPWPRSPATVPRLHIPAVTAQAAVAA